MEELFNKLLRYFNITEDDYHKLNEERELSNFDYEHHFDHIEDVSNFINDFIINNKKIAIYGDYDADGILGTSILVKMFKYLNKNVSYYIPNRPNDGYGINMIHAEEFVNSGVDLVITVDNGITAFEPIKYLKDKGVAVVILDHHTNEDTLPNADYILHPSVSNYSLITSSGAFVAFSLSRVILNRTDKYLATLASISLISDMMPLKDQNRHLLKNIIANYTKGEFLQIDLLLNDKKFDYDTIGMTLAPRINSLGRMKSDATINEIVEYFVSDNKTFILNYSSEIERINNERKNISLSASENIIINKDEPAIIVQSEYSEGIIGLIANSLLMKYHKPVIVFSKENDGIIKGSARSVDGFNLVSAFSEFDQYFITRGGHSLAAGCSIYLKDFEEFKEKFINCVNNFDLSPVAPDAIEISLNDINKENLNLIKSFSPFGQEWPQPILSIKHLKVSELNYSKNNLHIMKYIGLNKKIVGFGFSKEKMSHFTFIDTYGYLTSSFFLNKESIDYSITKIFKTKL